MLKKLFFHVFLIYFPLTALFAQNDSVLLAPVEIKSFHTTPFQANGALFSLDSNMSTANPYASLAELLTANTSLNIKSYGTGLSTISIRGTSSAHTSVIWNGFNIQSPMNGGVDLSLISAASADKIAVLSGSESAFLGNAALGGAIYLNNGSTVLKDGFHGNGASGIGSYGDLKRAAAFSFSNSRWKLAGKYVGETAMNDFIFNNIATIGSPIEREKFAAFKKTNLLFNTDYRIDEKQSIQLNEWIQYANREIEPNMIETNAFARQFDWAWRTAATYKRLQKGQNVFKIKTAWLEDDLLYYSDVQDSSKNYTKTLIGGIEENWFFSNLHFIKTGLTFTKNLALSNNYNGRRERNRTDVFISYSGEKPDNLKWSASLNGSTSDGKLLPLTFSMGFQKYIYRQLTIRADFSKIYHLPSLNDLYWGYLGNPTLAPESGWQEELALRYSAGPENKRREANLTFFNINIDNWIQWAPSVGYWKPRNYKKVWSRGAELYFKSVYQKENCKWEGRAGYQLTITTNGGVDSALFGKQLIYTPRSAFNAHLRLDYKNAFFVFRQSYTGLRFYLTDDSKSVDPYALSDLESGLRLNLRQWKILASLTVNNFLNTNYQAIEYTPSPKRNYRLIISISF